MHLRFILETYDHINMYCSNAQRGDSHLMNTCATMIAKLNSFPKVLNCKSHNIHCQPPYA
jgi:hypothetical protein